ncbi:MAG: aldehyde dehydrogenase [Veillonellales bacterium]
MNIDEERIANIVAKVLMTMPQGAAAPQPDINEDVYARTGKFGAVAAQGTVSRQGSEGVFADITAAIKAAKNAQQQLMTLSLAERGNIIDAIRKASIDNVETIARIANEETGYGRVPDKIQKKLNAARLTPGIEDIKVEAKTGDGGLVLIERAPFGVIASIEPATHPGSCIINHAISMIAAGNSIVLLPHPKGIRTAIEMTKLYNRAIAAMGGPENLIVVGDKVSMDNFNTVLSHPDIDLIVATGGPDVVKKALSSGKKAIGAGPGNPPAVVDETVDLSYAAKCIVDGASFDNTVLCIAEKVIIAVDKIADELLFHLEQNGAYLVRDENDKARLVDRILPNGEKFAPDMIGKDAALILNAAGIAASNDIRIAVAEFNGEHPLVMKEQLMPVIPFVRVKDFDEALALAVKVEQGFHHTAVIHSQDVTRITRYAKALKVDIMVVNGPSGAGLAVGAEGHYSHTISSPTGEGICTPKTYTREERTVIVGSLYTV